jgi:alpha-galactosidase
MMRTSKTLRLARSLMLFAFAAGILLLGTSLSRADEKISLGKLDLHKVMQGWGSPHADQSVDNHPLTIGGKKFEKGLGTHATSILHIDLHGDAKRFTASVGVDDEVKEERGSIVFQIYGDGKQLWKSNILHCGNEAESVDVDLSGVKTLVLMVDDAGDGIAYDHADWADAEITFVGTAPQAIDPPREEAVILTPKPSLKPRINGAKVFGVRPSSPFMFTIAATGQRPIEFAAENLPEGLTLDSQTGRITGVLKEKGEWTATLKATNDLGTAERKFKIVCGDLLALTPPMGWNSWNCFAGAVDDAKVRSAADAMVRSGLIDHGWTYINIDDCWEKQGGTARDSKGMINSNEKFLDMKALCQYIHDKGLKAGIYSSPGPQTCAGFPGSYQHENQDAMRYAEWGFDYLKYDWCSYDNVAKDKTLPELMKPYLLMRAALNKVDRDIVYSLCQYGMGDVWKWGAEVGGNCWRTTGDIGDSWSSMAGIGFSQNGHEKYAGPGHWNDPDMLVVGLVGWGNLHPTGLTPNEQYTHISLWCLLCSPLLIGCDMSQLDNFTLNLLTNDEVLEVNQDPLGNQAKRVAEAGPTEVWAKNMEDGSKAVGLFNRGEMETTVTVKWSDLGLSGRQTVRDLWRQKDLGEQAESYSAKLGRHGCALIRVSPVGK